MSDKPLISVVVPAYNHETYIADTIQSIWQQHALDLELIVIDDGSKDKTYTIAQQLAGQAPLPMTVVRQENQGLTRTLNRALHMAAGAFVAVIASDDLFAPDRFTAQLALFQANDEMAVVFGNGRNFRDGQMLERIHDKTVVQLLHQEPTTVLHYLYTHVPVLYAQTCLYRTDFLRQIGGWDETMLLDDWVLNIRVFRSLSRKAQYGYVDEEVVYRRLHDTNISNDFSVHKQRIWQVMETYVPAEYQRTLRSDVYWQFALMATQTPKQRRQMLEYVVRSQALAPNLSRLSFITQKAAVKAWHKMAQVRKQALDLCQKNGSRSE